MVSTCSAFGCKFRHKKNIGIGLFKFPTEEKRRLAWIAAVRRKNWQPSPVSRICGQHFQTGRPHKDPDHPDYVPNIFCFTKKITRTIEDYERERSIKPQIIVLEKVKTEEQPESVLPSVSAVEESYATGGSYEAKSAIHPGIIVQGVEGIVEPQITMSLSAYQNMVSQLTAENDRLQGENENLKGRNKSLQGDNERLQDEVRKLRIDNMVDIALEMNCLREEIRTLKEKLERSQFTSLLLSDNKKLQFYTGIADLESFNNILSYSKDLVDLSFTIPEEQQLLIVLVKLKMKFREEDLAFRFNVSKRTVRRVLSTWLPILSVESEE